MPAPEQNLISGSFERFIIRILGDDLARSDDFNDLRLSDDSLEHPSYRVPAEKNLLKMHAPEPQRMNNCTSASFSLPVRLRLRLGAVADSGLLLARFEFTVWYHAYITRF